MLRLLAAAAHSCRYAAERKAVAATKRGKAAWSKLEDVLAEKRLQKVLKDVYDDV